MNSNFPIGDLVCGPPPKGAVAATPEPRTSAPSLRKSVVAWLLFASCCVGAAGRAFGQAGSQSGAQTGTQSPGAMTNEAPAQPAASSPMPIANQAMLYPGEDFTLSAGDLVAVAVFMQGDYAATVRLKLDGTAELPLIGSVPLQGLTVQAAQNLIADRLRTGGFFNQPEVTIRVIDTVNGSVMVTGEMRAQIPLANERSLRDVLLTAGGLPANANHTVKIVRPGVHPHDIIQVSRASVVYVLGAFSHQGAVPLDQATPLTLLQLAALSGGINYEGKYDDLRLIRTVGTERKVIDVDIKKIRDGKAADPILQANDIVFLPTDDMKAVLKNLGVGGVIGLVSLLYVVRSF